MAYVRHRHSPPSRSLCSPRSWWALRKLARIGPPWCRANDPRAVTAPRCHHPASRLCTSVRLRVRLGYSVSLVVATTTSTSSAACSGWLWSGPRKARRSASPPIWPPVHRSVPLAADRRLGCPDRPCDRPPDRGCRHCRACPRRPGRRLADP